MSILKNTAGLSLMLTISITLSGCLTNGGHINLIGINDDNCIICIRQTAIKSRTSDSASTRQPPSAPADVSTHASSVTPVPGTGRETPMYAIDDHGTTKAVTSRYGDLYLIQADDEYRGERQVLIFNGQPVYDPMNPPGYKGDDEDIVGNFLNFDKPIRLGDYDIIPVSSASGGSGQEKFAHGLVSIGPDKRAKAFGHDGMLSRSSKLRIENGHVLAEYDRLTLLTDGQTSTIRQKRMDNVPDDVCAGLYKYRKDLAEAWKTEQNFSAAGNALDGWGDAALEYKAFKPDALIKSSGKISYAKFKKQVCGG